jgi:hypothetical protein
LANGVVDWEQMGNKTFVQLDFGLDLVLKNKDFSTFFLCIEPLSLSLAVWYITSIDSPF